MRVMMILLIEKGKRSASSTAAFALMESLDADVVQKVRQTASKVRLCRSAKGVVRSRKRNRHQGSALARRHLVPIEGGVACRVHAIPRAARSSVSSSRALVGSPPAKPVKLPDEPPTRWH